MPDPVPSVPDEVVEARTCIVCGFRHAPDLAHNGQPVVPMERLAIAKAQRDEARAQSEALRDEGRKFADWLERDRREPDKVLCVVQSMRRAFRESQEPDHAA